MTEAAETSILKLFYRSPAVQFPFHSHLSLCVAQDGISASKRAVPLPYVFGLSHGPGRISIRLKVPLKRLSTLPKQGREMIRRSIQ